MASIREYTRKDGTTTFYVRWRDRETGRETSQAVPDRHRARQMKRFLDSNGQSYRAASRAALDAKLGGPTVEEVLEQHIDSRTGVTPRTVADYRRDARNHIVPRLGDVPAKALSPLQVRDWVNGLAKAGMKSKSIANVHGLLSAAMQTAMRDGLRADNPCKGVRLPDREHNEDDRIWFLTLAQYEGLLACFPEEWKIVPELLFATGMRWGEATALMADDLYLDDDSPFVSVVRAWKRGETATHYLAKPKSRRSVRDISIDSGLANMLAEQLERNGDPGAPVRYSNGRERGELPGNFVLRGAEGGQLHYSNFQARVWTPALNKAIKEGVLRERPTIHCLRHTHASLLLQDGVPMLTVSRRLGHESVNTTTSIYGHLVARTERGAADAIGRMRNRGA
jgi:integrase